jgi:Ca2+-binding RTX toxin-like protein
VKELVRLTILFLGAMLGMLVVAGGVALADDAVGGQCGDWFKCTCTGGLCKGTPGDDSMFGTDLASGDKIFGLAGDDSIHAEAGGDYVDAGPGVDFIQGDAAGGLYGSGNDTLYGGDENDEIYGYGGYDECYGGPGDDYLDPSCEKAVQ